MSEDTIPYIGPKPQAPKVPVDVQLRANYPGDKPWPMYMTAGASGFDLRFAHDERYKLESGCAPQALPTGLAFAIPLGYELQIRPRSGRSLEGIQIINAPGTVDADFRGEVEVLVRNVGPKTIVLKPGERIAQAVLVPVAQAEFNFVKTLDETERAEGGFGHTGND